MPPEINDKFPIRESLSPPIVAAPVYECAEAVFVTGFVPHAQVRVFANTSEMLAEVEPPFGFAEITLKRRVKLGESLTATQTVGNFTSPHSIQPVIVSALPENAVKTQKPEVGKQLFECGIVVPVGNLVPSVRVHVREDGQEIANVPVAQPWHAVLTQPLHAGGKVSAQQFACEGTTHEIKGVVSDEVVVQAAPSPIPPPQPVGDSIFPGNDTVTLTGLLVGAGVEIFDNGNLISSGWFATGDANYFPTSPALSNSPSITATQQLCGNVSDPSDPVKPTGRLRAPIVLAPICDGSRFVIVRGTTLNAIVVVMRNGSIVGYGGAGPGDVILGLGAGTSLNAGDVVTAIQYIGSIVSPTSNSVTVSRRLEQPFVEILGGEPFFLARAGEQSIDGPVFPRGRGAGPVIRIQACCSQNVELEVIDPKGNVAAKLPLNELFPGYFTATWPWTSLSNWAIPNEIPVGQYQVVVRTGCEQKLAIVPFYVIFNPADVGGPARFSFDDTAVWFGAGSNSLQGLHYFLHQSDARVFSIALNAASGHTDSFAAAIAVARAEEALFAYSLSFHTKDVVDLIVNYTEAQCADDAGCLTALLRAIGIPAHPVTADAGLETGAANWTFDTWVEFLAPSNGVTEWRIFHPHEYPGMQPESRGTFGSTRGVATKGFNDVIVMANESWVMSQLDDGGSDVSYTRNNCQEPNQTITKTHWIDELCEQGYWSSSHWDCAGVRTRSLSIGDGFRLLDHDLSFGGRLAGILHVVNRTEDRNFGDLAVELVADLPESKEFPEKTFGRAVVPTMLDHGKSLTVPFELKLPKTLAPGRNLYLWAHLNGRTAAIQEVRIPPRITCEVSSSSEFTTDELATVRAVISNPTTESVRDVRIEVEAPFALEVEPRYLRFEEIRPYESREVAFRVRAVAQLRSGSLRIAISSSNGGGILVRRPFAVAGEEPVIDATPGLLLERKPSKSHKRS